MATAANSRASRTLLSTVGVFESRGDDFLPLPAAVQQVGHIEGLLGGHLGQ